MSNLPNDSDSTELARLRAMFRFISHQRATPVRLGLFARAIGFTITDFGSHSKRWTIQFTKGRCKL